MSPEGTIFFWIPLALLVLGFFLSLAFRSQRYAQLQKIIFVLQRLIRGEFHARVVDPPRGDLSDLGKTVNALAEAFEAYGRGLSMEKTPIAAILENMAEAVVALDSNGHILAINPMLTKLFGVPENEARGRLFLEVIRHPELNAIVQSVLTDGQVRMEEVQTFSPEERFFEVHVAPLHQAERQVGVLVVLHDITRIRRLEQVRRDFVANVSHELRTPLASIKGFAETLREGGMEDLKNRNDFVKSIEKQADRMIDLVDDLLQLTTIESGKAKQEGEALLLTDLIQDVCEGLKPLADRKKISLSIDLPATAVKIQASKKQMRQVLVNLLENAIKFNVEKGQVKVTAHAGPQTVTISIEDTGVGIPAKDLPRIFERFYRVDKARSREMGGTGLGLSIVKHIVEAHGGKVAVESVEHKGTTFRITLPVEFPSHRTT